MACARAAVVLVLVCAWSGCAGWGRDRDLDEVVVHLDVRQVGAFPADVRWSEVLVHGDPEVERMSGQHLNGVCAFERSLREALAVELPVHGRGEHPLQLSLDFSKVESAPDRVGGVLVVDAKLGRSELRIAEPIGTPEPYDAMAAWVADRISAALIGRTATVETVFLTDKSAPITRAIEHARAGKLAEAKTLFEIASRNAPAHQDIAWFALGQLAFAENDLPRARECYTKAWRLVPDPRYQAALERTGNGPLPPPR